VKARRRPHKPSAARPPRLFAEPERPPDHAQDAYIAHIDGAARGNPGPASYAVILCRPDGRPLDTLRKYVGRATNNVAEYLALLAALDYAHAHRISRLRVRSDSELLVRQMQGRYKVKSADLRPLYERARKLSAGLAYFSIEHVPREQNREADALANAALDEPAAGARELRARGRQTRKIRARYHRGALHPAEPIDLAEGEEVEIVIDKLRWD